MSWLVLRCGVDEKSIIVIFLCTVWPIVPSKFLVTRTSRKGKAAFSFLSIVKLMFWWTTFRRFGNSCSSCFPCRHTTEVLSVYCTSGSPYLQLCLWLSVQRVPQLLKVCHYRRQGNPTDCQSFCW